MKTKKIFSYLFLIILLIILELGLLTGICAIPKKYIQENVQTSAEFLCEKAPFFHLLKNDTASRIDRYADAILMNIAWSCDCEHPLQSALCSAYYQNDAHNENTNLLFAVTQDAPPTYEYMRYWHGSLVVLRPLLIFFSVREIYILCAAILFVLLGISAYSIYRNYGKAVIWCFLCSALVCSVWFVPFSLEYIPTFFIGFAAIPITIALQKKAPDKLSYLFLSLGSLTAYTDFLTTETLTCLLPMIFVLLAQKKTDTKPFSLCIKNGAIWFAGYCTTWISKWLLYSAFTGKNGLSDALTQTAYRTGGEVVPDGLFAQIFGAFLRNLRCLFPFSLIKDPGGTVTSAIVLVIIGMLFFLVKKQKNMPSIVSALWMIGILPYLRYAVLSNHSFIHYFFTYRAQFVSVFCLFLIFAYGTDTDFLKKEWKKINGVSR
jgi:hypothetical protein